MKSFAAVALLASVAYAQLPNIPNCALNCFVTALTSDGCSSLTDFACHCQKTELIGTVTPCVQAACTADEVATVLKAVQDTCESAGHPISIPSQSSAAATSAAPASSAAAESSAAASSVASEVSSAVSSAASAASSAASAASSAASSVAAATTSGSASSASSSSTPSPFSGAAARPTQVGVLMAALGLAAAAL